MMSLTTRGRYAARIMINLARRADAPPATKRAIGEAEDISSDYIEQIMIRLRSAGLVRSHRGRKGGFSLARPPEEITLAEVLNAVEGPVSPVPCLHDHCERAPSCPTRPIWKRAAEAVEKVFAEATIAELAASGREAAQASYQI